MPFSFKPTEAVNTGNPTPTSVDGITPPSSIPSPANTQSSSRFSGEKTGIVQILLVVIFVMCVLVAGALFGYNYYLSGQIESKKERLASYEKEFSTLNLKDMQALSSRMKVIATLVRDHPSVLASFRILEESVENPVVYKNFDLHYSESNRSYELVLAANAPDYHSVVDQMDTFKRKPFSNYVKTVDINGLHPDSTGKVTFNLKMPIAITGVLPESLVFQDIVDAMEIATSTSSGVGAEQTGGTVDQSVIRQP